MVYSPEDDSYLLLETTKEYLKNIKKKLIVLEMGAGSGIISFSIANKVKKVYSVDIDQKAIDFMKKELKKFSEKNKAIKNLTIIQSDLFKNISETLKFDLIIFNPPYLPEETKIENDIALNTGKQGNEIIIEFLEQAKNNLNIDGEILLLFSSLSKRNKILKKAKELNYEHKLLSKKIIFFEKLYVYKFKPKEYLLAKGHRGLIYIFKKGKQKLIRKIPLKESKALSNIENEARFNKLLNKHGIAPRFISFDKETNSLIREYIEGENIGDFFIKHNKKEIIIVLKKIFLQLLKMDSLRINKFEMTNPYKHIIIKNNKPYMIDFERCRFTETPKNITQFLQYLSSANIEVILKKKKIFIDKDKLISLSKEYKKNYNENLINDFLGRL
jgi:HemK-related putative methylase